MYLKGKQLLCYENASVFAYIVNAHGHVLNNTDPISVNDIFFHH